MEDAAKQCQLPPPGAGGLARPTVDAFLGSHIVLAKPKSLPSLNTKNIFTLEQDMFMPFTILVMELKT